MKPNTTISRPQIKKQDCPNKSEHVSAFPAFDRVRYPVCSVCPCNEMPVYVKVRR